MRHSRLKLILVLLVFIGPVIVAYLWYFGLGKAYFPTEKINHARLLTPPVVLELSENSRINLDRRWVLLHGITQECEKECETALYNSRQVRLALGKDSTRVKRFIFIDNDEIQNWLAKEHADATQVNLSDALYRQIQQIMQENNLEPNDAILVDPLGNAMMVIPASLEPKLFLKDMKKLMRLSQIG